MNLAGNWYFVFAYAFAVSFALSLVLTAWIRRLAVKFDILDHPGHRKVHAEAIPLMGGVAIFVSFCLIIALHVVGVYVLRGLNIGWVRDHVLSFLGTGLFIKLLGIFGGGLLVFLLGVVDDIKPIRPLTKLFGQILAAVILVSAGVRIDVMNPYVWLANVVTVLWVVGMTNSLNLLDNMDGLCGGVSVIAAFSFFLCLVPQGDTFVCVMLMIFAGSVSGFLCHNMNPAKIFMGDAGSMFCGYALATAAVLGTYYSDVSASGLPWAAPVLALSVPIFDTVSVIVIRRRLGVPIMQGDKRHFSHRLVDMGMTHAQAVLFIFMVAAITGFGAALLPRVGRLGALILVGQTIGIFALIVILMRVGARREADDA